MVAIGDIIKIDYIPENNLESKLFRFPSMYGFENIYFRPKRDKEYIVCDGDPSGGFHLVEKEDFSIPIGFCLIFIKDVPFVRVTQVNHDPEPVISVQIIGKAVDIPPRGHNIGSIVVLATK